MGGAPGSPGALNYWSKSSPDYPFLFDVFFLRLLDTTLARLGPKMVPKWCQNRPKMEPKSEDFPVSGPRWQNDPRIHQKTKIIKFFERGRCARTPINTVAKWIFYFCPLLFNTSTQRPNRLPKTSQKSWKKILKPSKKQFKKQRRPRTSKNAPNIGP